jgi:hypothetical protein
LTFRQRAGKLEKMPLILDFFGETFECDSGETRQVLRVLKRIEHNMRERHKETMSAISDLQTATADLQTADSERQSAVLAAIADIKSLPATDAQIVPLTAVITKVAANTKADTAALLAAIAPPTPVPPAPAPA